MRDADHSVGVSKHYFRFLPHDFLHTGLVLLSYKAFGERECIVSVSCMDVSKEVAYSVTMLMTPVRNVIKPCCVAACEYHNVICRVTFFFLT